MKRILVVEDQPRDMRLGAEIAQSAGFENVQTCVSGTAAWSFLHQGLAGAAPLPDAILLDLDLGTESGHELLRLRYCDPDIGHIPVEVWTGLGEENRRICELFKIYAYVPKWEGPAPLRQVLKQLTSGSAPGTAKESAP